MTNPKAIRDDILVVALGGNALVRSPNHASIRDQAETVRSLAPALVDLALGVDSIVVTHGNGPQVGYILRRSELALGEVAPVPIDYAVGDTQGAIGHMFLLAVRSELAARRVDRPVVALTTQVLVDADDPAFATPNKPVGAIHDEATARRNAERFGWTIAEDSGHGWRRTVPSPEPIRILELPVIRSLLAANTIVVACGGGGIPVVDDGRGGLAGVEAVVDKDRTSALLADALDARTLLISTNVPAIALDYRGPSERWVSSLTVSEVDELLASGAFEGGMAPKIAAISQFVGRGKSRRGIVTSIDLMVEAVAGRAGTTVGA